MIRGQHGSSGSSGTFRRQGVISYILHELFPDTFSINVDFEGCYKPHSYFMVFVDFLSDIEIFSL